MAALGLGTGLGTAWLSDRFTPLEAQLIGLAALFALLFGFLGAWSHALEPDDSAVDPNIAAEASLLLRRLHELADTLDTGFDAPGSAEMALQDLAARPQVQERLTSALADLLMERLQPLGAAVVIEARHLCLEMRGVRSPGSMITTSALRGAFEARESTRMEFFTLIRSQDGAD